MSVLEFSPVLESVDLLVSLLIDSLPLTLSERAVEPAEVDEIEMLFKEPRLQSVLYREDTIGRNPGCGWWIEVDTLNQG